MKKKLLFALKNMVIGGVEKSLLSLLNTIDQDQYEVDLLFLENYGGFMEEIPHWVNVIICEEYSGIQDAIHQPPLAVMKNHIQKKQFFRAGQLFWGYFKTKCTGRTQYYYQSVFKVVPIYKKHYDVAISYMSLLTYLTWLVNYHVDADTRVGWIHSDISKLSFNHDFLAFLHQNMDKICVVSQDALKTFIVEFPELKEKCELRYNVINQETILQLAEVPTECIRESGVKTIMTLGRLAKEKGQDIIPEVARKLQDEGVHFKWYLIGDGGLRKTIEEKCSQYEVGDCIVLLGAKTNPYPYLKQADVYVQTSVLEGYCITLAEAKIFGIPIVSTDFAGAHEQLADIPNSRIVRRETDKITQAVMELL